VRSRGRTGWPPGVWLLSPRSVSGGPDRSANEPASSVGDLGSVDDLGQPCLVLFFEAAEVTGAVECHH